MKHKELVHSIAQKLDVSEKEIEKWLQSTTRIMITEMRDGNSIGFQGFGVFELRRREERLSVHPATKARTLIPPKLVANFKQSATFKGKLKQIPQHE